MEACRKKIASFLGLTNSEMYTGHCFRRTSASLSANAGVDVSVLKRNEGWKSNSIAEKYVEESFEGKNEVALMIQGGKNFLEVLQAGQSKGSMTSTRHASNCHSFV